jgi:hypothetical protein
MDAEKVETQSMGYSFKTSGDKEKKEWFRVEDYIIFDERK